MPQLNSRPADLFALSLSGAIRLRLSPCAIEVPMRLSAPDVPQHKPQEALRSSTIEAEEEEVGGTFYSAVVQCWEEL
jgi:hypothetical protein